MVGEIMDVEFITDEHLGVDLGEIAGSGSGGGTTVISVKANYNQTNPNADDYIIGRENIVGKEDLASVTEEILAEAKASGEFDGEDGEDGADGKDGISPTLSISTINGGHRIEVYDVIGIRSFVVKDGENGADGKDGADGYSPIRGTDYWTDADKASIVTDVINALPTWEGGNY